MKTINLIFAIPVVILIGCDNARSYMDGTECDCDSIHSEYYSDGNVWMDSPYRGGKVDGLRKVYFHNGNVLRVVEYIGGEANGILVDYRADGTVLDTATLTNGIIKQ